ncbi:MAG: hypothetical protein NVSMB46_04160 [Candidatus Saccharimonadales bacterium]
MWIFWALVSAVLVASRRPFEKKIMNELHHFTYGFLVQCVSLPILAAIVILDGKLLNPFSLSVRFWLPVIIVSVGFYPLNTFLYKHAIKDGELSKVLPLQSLWPVFTLLLAWLTIGEVPGIVAAAGVILTVLGIYALGLKGRRLHHPLQPFREDSSSKAMLAGVLLVTFVSILDKIAIQASNPLFYSLASTLGAILTLFVAMSISKQTLTYSLRPLAKQISIIGTLQGTTYATYLLAVAAGPIAYVSALRSTNILMGSILGIYIFKERLTKPKAVSFLLIVAGAVLLTFGSSK